MHIHMRKEVAVHQPTNADILSAIQKVEQRLGARIEGLEIRITGIETRLTGLEKQVGNLEIRISTLEKLVSEFRKEVKNEFASIREEMRSIHKAISHKIANQQLCTAALIGILQEKNCLTRQESAHLLTLM